MNAVELREKDVAALTDELMNLRKEQFQLRLQKATGQLGQTHLLKLTQREIARVKTIIAEKQG
ncbi:50S ribosomal protein L29 [Litorivicinus lipolyticus]|jgi:large subunit ribosomal protein L29|uniref:Large ribosomal subunit protein uL29 n=1 Tax=Litorivicinus lipolyticus TaxID=418701 RepID=A0A5Q2QC34_9GAMM|nr:50S ribosomal protein L29 [Litorivicinus lipolyticus]QGG80853.1 50S ribosomal protein L29 [Litorivicinus lipolyticus]